MNIKKRVWPDGTQKAVEVLMVERHPEATILTVCDTSKEGYVLLGGGGDEAQARTGDRGIIRFVATGPASGYWRYTARPRTDG